MSSFLFLPDGITAIGLALRLGQSILTVLVSFVGSLQSAHNFVLRFKLILSAIVMSYVVEFWLNLIIGAGDRKLGCLPNMITRLAANGSLSWEHSIVSIDRDQLCNPPNILLISAWEGLCSPRGVSVMLKHLRWRNFSNPSNISMSNVISVGRSS